MKRCCAVLVLLVLLARAAPVSGAAAATERALPPAGPAVAGAVADADARQMALLGVQLCRAALQAAGADAYPGPPAVVRGEADTWQNQEFVFFCIRESWEVTLGVWDLLTGIVLNSSESPECFSLAAVGKALNIVESVMAYRICVMEYSEEEPDEEQIQALRTLRKLLMVIDEFLYIVELLACQNGQ
ncbi:hypothetical protein ACFL43_04660 [Thermodesulfobacteriota bacterium]